MNITSPSKRKNLLLVAWVALIAVLGCSPEQKLSQHAEADGARESIQSTGSRTVDGAASPPVMSSREDDPDEEAGKLGFGLEEGPNGLSVHYLRFGMPAELAGIRWGDILTAIEDQDGRQSTSGQSVKEVLTHLEGGAGQQVTLHLEDGRTGATRKVRLTRVPKPSEEAFLIAFKTSNGRKQWLDIPLSHIAGEHGGEDYEFVRNTDEIASSPESFIGRRIGFPAVNMRVNWITEYDHAVLRAFADAPPIHLERGEVSSDFLSYFNSLGMFRHAIIRGVVERNRSGEAELRLHHFTPLRVYGEIPSPLVAVHVQAESGQLSERTLAADAHTPSTSGGDMNYPPATSQKPSVKSTILNWEMMDGVIGWKSGRARQDADSVRRRYELQVPGQGVMAIEEHNDGFIISGTMDVLLLSLIKLRLSKLEEQRAHDLYGRYMAAGRAGGDESQNIGRYSVRFSPAPKNRTGNPGTGFAQQGLNSSS